MTPFYLLTIKKRYAIRNYIKKLLCVPLLILLAGCASFVRTASHYPDGRFPPTPVEKVVILYQNPDRQYKVIGELTVLRSLCGNLWQSDQIQIKKEVAIIGGDAALLTVKKQLIYEPPRTVINTQQTASQEDQLSSKQFNKEIIYHPAEYHENCPEEVEGKIIKFLD